MRESYLIKVRSYGCEYIARGGGKSASCTMDAETAVERVAMKIAGFTADYNAKNYVPFEKTGIRLTWSADKGSAYASWEVK